MASPLEQVKQGILSGNMSLVVAGYNAMTGESLTAYSEGSYSALREIYDVLVAHGICARDEASVVDFDIGDKNGCIPDLEVYVPEVVTLQKQPNGSHVLATESIPEDVEFVKKTRGRSRQSAKLKEE